MSFIVKFKVNEILEISESASENMMLSKLVYNILVKRFLLKEENKVSFFLIHNKYKKIQLSLK